jgi:hypothetical protein
VAPVLDDVRSLTGVAPSGSVHHMSPTEDISAPGGLTIELETASLAVRLLGLGAGTQQWQFVGKVDQRPMFTSATFAAPYSWGGVPMGKTTAPREEWAPGMTRALDDLKSEIEHAGWVEVTRGPQLWDIGYQHT